MIDDEKRMMDLIRYQRAELHQAGLITDEEYAELCKIGGAVGRLEGYDDIRNSLERLKDSNSSCEKQLEIMRSERHVDKVRMDWLERNLRHLSHDRTTNSVNMGGLCVHGQLVNEARGPNAGPSYFQVNHQSIRAAIDDAMKGQQ